MLPWLHAVPEGERRGERIGSGRRGEVIGVREVGRGRGRKEGREDRKRIGRVELEERSEEHPSRSVQLQRASTLCMRSSEKCLH